MTIDAIQVAAEEGIILCAESSRQLELINRLTCR